MSLPYRQLHSGRARTVSQLYLELDEWSRLTASPVLGYAITFICDAASGGDGRKYNLHADATRDAVELFLDLYRQSGLDRPAFVVDRAHSSVAKACVRLADESAAARGFYNHCTEPASSGRQREALEPKKPPVSHTADEFAADPAGGRAAGLPTASQAAEALALLTKGSLKAVQVLSWDHWVRFKKESSYREWVYYARFGPEVFAWGTASKDGNRLRASSLFHEKLTGKYDRRVDYLMLKGCYGRPDVWVFEARDARRLESQLKERVGNAYCYGGLLADDRKAVSLAIFEQVKTTRQWLNQPPEMSALTTYGPGILRSIPPGRA